MVQVHLGPQAIEASAAGTGFVAEPIESCGIERRTRSEHVFIRALEVPMKKLLMLAAAVAAAAFVANKKNQQGKPADPWAQASDEV